MTKVVVTGGSGKAGRAVVRDLFDHGYDVLNVDSVPPTERIVPYLRADLTHYGETVEVLQGADMVVHLAAIPAPGIYTEEYTYRVNTALNFNVFQAAVALGLKRVVWASSETTLGLPFDREKPKYAPIDEDHPLYPESSYALSKVVGEVMAQQFNRWSGIPFVHLRISNIMELHDYIRFPSWQNDPIVRKWNLWGYVDARDVAQACRLGLEANTTGAEAFITAAADTCMNRSNRELMAEVFPGVPLRPDVGANDTLLSIDKARRVLGYEPQYSWRKLVSV
jgi:nucleoside-diphosphate-sugar epimerase